MAASFPLSDRASVVRSGCKTQRIAPTLRQVADLMCARIKEKEYFKTCIVGHVNCCLQCAPTQMRRCVPANTILSGSVLPPILVAPNLLLTFGWVFQTFTIRCSRVLTSASLSLTLCLTFLLALVFPC
ncbi:hypothetical protein PoB_000907500 [Plakobranchus ocellatus]|uniref:Uncharacterized protein n=1 Tax=Plakobranchus ocellatus TaxID=259542 RepID=A0AAV3YJ92_9GAST|nr:hypothetical protein PoB_000907500 [Plakobranchus ocellatus]